ncbi:tetratricopeptide repeat protein [Pseudomonas sp. Pseusp11]|uniref:tetratricopeptide repeat protein n=1 Tax=Pseudomonas sp. Pseusp11 TaxID=3243003 RepID=UPI00037AFA10
MKAAINFLVFALAVFFASISMAQNSLSLYASSSGSAAITEAHGGTSLLVLAGGNDAGQATSGSCVIAATLTAVEGGYEGNLLPINTELNSYSEELAQGKKLQIESNSGSIIINDADYVGICALDNSLVNLYEKVLLGDKKYKNVYAEMISLAHADALSLFKKGQRVEAIAELSPYASNYKAVWLADKELAGVVILAINDYAYFLQENNQAIESIPFLNDVVAAEPSRAVAWLNLADSNWAIGKKNDAAKQYAVYRNLMLKVNRKSKIPQRVFERSDAL